MALKCPWSEEEAGMEKMRDTWKFEKRHIHISGDIEILVKQKVFVCVPHTRNTRTSRSKATKIPPISFISITSRC